MPRLISATANPDKFRELEAIFKLHLGVEILPRPPDIPEIEETGKTLRENAMLKARGVLEWINEPNPILNLIVVADDTGLEVEALDGKPGVHSARYAGVNASYEDNVQKLILKMKSQKNRKAAFTTYAVALTSGTLTSGAGILDGEVIEAEGRIEGELVESPRGEGGFGYDALFVPGGETRTFAEMAEAEKNLISHRFKAVKSLAQQIEAQIKNLSD